MVGCSVMYQEPQLIHEVPEAEVASFMAPLPHREPICVVVPAYNEEQVIDPALRALVRVIDPAHVYVVSDGSTDKTAELALKHTKNVLDLPQNVGKARALKSLINEYQLTLNYEYVLFSDADSQLSFNFITEIKKFMAAQPACIVGTVTSDRHGLISAYRTYEYGLTHRVFKQAQSRMGTITVAPGCASLYRSDVLGLLDFTKHTLTEDFDLTLQIHEKKLGDIVYAPHARVLTQDPPTLHDYWKQITRWYTGFWQNIFLHKAYIPNKKVNMEIMLIVGDGLSWIAAISFAIINPLAFLSLVLMSAIITFILTIGILCLERQFWAMKYMLLFPLFQFINVTSYGYSFFRALGTQTKRLAWNKVLRY